MEMDKFNVVEIFNSIDGEGKRAGELTTFVRFAGCNLNCSYCDTKYAQSFLEGKEMTILEIIQEIEKIGNMNITLTGGEPLKRAGIYTLIEYLSITGYRVNIETNGSIPLYEAPKLKNVFYTMDYKCPSSNMENKMNLENLEFLDEDDVLKFVVGDIEDLKTAYDILKNSNIIAQIYLSPVFGTIEPKDIIEFMKQNYYLSVLFNVKIQLQLHKIIWNPEERGV